MIACLESVMRRLLPHTACGEFCAGLFLVIVVCLVSYSVPFVLLWGVGLLSPLARLIIECLLCWQLLATKSLRDAAMLVYAPLAAGDLLGARKAVSYIVGRDTSQLSEQEVSRAAVETVAENTSDGVVAPLFYFALGGAPLACLYKAINTMDSMLGYKNSRYLHFGKAAARLDDAANFIPARITGVMMVVASFLCRFDTRASWRILLRDRSNHSSPNAGWPEAACAGALGIQLGGSASYGGSALIKPTLGDALKEIHPEDILKTCKLELTTALLCVGMFALLRSLVLVLILLTNGVML